MKQMYERKINWIELFFDLVFVAAAHQMAVVLLFQETFLDAFPFILLFLPILWVWVGHTMFSNRFEDTSGFYKIITVAMMAAVVGLVITLPQAFGAYTTGFALSYAISRFCLIALYLRAMLRNSSLHPQLIKTVGAFCISALLWFISAFVPGAVYIWILAFTIDVLTPILAHRELSAISQKSTHLLERLGLLTVIMLGEMIISTTASTFNIRLTVDLVLLLLFGLVLIATISWRYFVFSEACLKHETIHEKGIVFLYTHLPLFVGLVCVAGGFKGIITQKETAWLILIGVLFIIISYQGIKYLHFQKSIIPQSVLFLIVLPFISTYPFFTQSMLFNVILLSIIISVYLIISDSVNNLMATHRLTSFHQKKTEQKLSQKEWNSRIFND